MTQKKNPEKHLKHHRPHFPRLRSERRIQRLEGGTLERIPRGKAIADQEKPMFAKNILMIPKMFRTKLWGLTKQKWKVRKVLKLVHMMLWAASLQKVAHLWIPASGI